MQAWGGESGSSGDLRGGDQRDPRWVSGGRRAAASGCECYSGVGPAAPGPDESHVWPLAGGGDGGGSVPQSRCAPAQVSSPPS